VTGGEGEPLTGGEDAPVTGREGEPFTGREGAPVTRGEGAPVTGREDATVTGAAQAAPVVPARLAEAAGTGAEVAFRAPGRANLIGEHTDYNDGFVLPLALEAATWVCGRRVDGVARLRSLEQPGEVEVDLASGDGPEQGWGRYVTAVVRALRDAGVALRGFEGVLASDVPIGAGLSSSAALEMAVAWALLAEERPAHELARICQRAENRYVGVRSGIMDQLASAAGRPGQALLIDCRSLELEPVPVPDTLRVVLLDSAVQRQLGDSAYNERRAQCEQAAAALGVAALRDADPELLEAHAAELDPVVYRRARPGRRQDLQRLVEHACAPPVVEFLAGDGELAGEAVAAEADPERQPAAREPVERGGLPGDLDRPAPRQRRDHGAEPDALGGGGDRRQRDPRVGHVDDRLPPAHVVPHEHPVPASLLRLGGQPDDDRRVGKLVEDRQEQT
jgi:hypothetical protein